MSASDFRQVKAIFTAAAELDGAARLAYLDGACGGDAALRAQVEDLLAQTPDTETAAIFDRPPERRTLAPGDLVAARFRVTRFLGRGGMGEVYQVDDLELGGSLALKTLKPDLAANPEFLKRFRREVQTARQVTHPNVCRVFDLGHDPVAGAFLTMEYLDGGSLSMKLKSGRAMEPGEALSIANQMAGGLAAIHAAGIVHRDLKPANVMLTLGASGAPRAVLADFGLARALEDDSGATQVSRPGLVMGTPEYMAPEQVMGHSATPASDLYSMGLILFEMATGSRPSRGLGSAPVPELSGAWAGLYQQVVSRCLTRDPFDRPESASAVAALLDGRSRAAAVPTRRRGLIFAIAAAIFFGLAALIAGLSRLGVWTGKPDSGQHVAMLPLRVMSQEPGLREFGMGLTESITARLSQYDSGNSPLLVVPASEVRSQNVTSAADARSKFNVTAAVEGSVQQQAGRVRLLLTIIDTRAMRQIESLVVEDLGANAFRLQDTAVSRLAGVLNVRLRATQASSQPEGAVAPGAYEFYLQARGYLQRPDQAASLASAITLFERALKADPQFGLAHSGLGEAYERQFELSREPALVKSAVEAGRRGVELSPGAPQANIAQGHILQRTGNYKEARAAFEKAISLDPRSAEGHRGLANAFASLGDQASAEATHLQAIALRPADWSGYKALGLHYFDTNQWPKAATQFEKVVELSPDNAQGYVNLGGAHAMTENWAGAEKAWLKALDLDPKRTSTQSNLGKLYFDRGEYAKAIGMYQRALAAGGRSYRAWGQLGRSYQKTGEQAKASEAYGKALAILDDELRINANLPRLLFSQSHYRALVGRPDYAEPLRRAMALSPAHWEPLSQAAETYAAIGNRPQALVFMRRALDAGLPESTARRTEFLRDLLPEAAARKP